MAFTIDWNTPGLDINGGSANTISDGPETMDVTITTPVTSGEEFEIRGSDSRYGETVLESDLLNTSGIETSTTFTFASNPSDTEAGNVTFDILDIDAGTTPAAWDDLVTITAFDINGNPVDVSITADDGQVVDENAGTINGVNPDGANSNTVHVEISGPVAYFTISFTQGTSGITPGYIGIGAITFEEYVPDCFTRGTMIETINGEVAIEDLKVGDLVRTLDNGYQPLRWVKSTTVSAKSKSAPVQFKKGAIGNTRDLLLSPAHRIMLQDWQSELLFDNNEMLVSAKSLVNDGTITVQKRDSVEYFHILFGTHEIVFSNGAPTESFHPGEVGRNKLNLKTRNEVLGLFPELLMDVSNYGPPVRASLNQHEAAIISK